MPDFYCPVCNVRKVSREGELCSSCQDPYDQINIPVTGTTSGPVQNTESDNSGYVPVSKPNRRIMPTPGAAQPTSGNRRRSIVTPSQPTGAVNQASGPAQYAAPVQSSVPVQSAAPVQPVIPPSVQPAGNAAQPAAGQVSKDAPLAEGIVKNISAGKNPESKLTRWFRSLALGTPFAQTDDMTEFQIYTNWTGSSNSGGYSADKVVVYGTIQQGKLVQDNSVRVYGIRDKNRVIIAKDIENTSDGVFSVFYPRPIPGKMVRIITLAVMAIIVLLILLLASGSASAGAGIGDKMTNLVVAVIGGVAAFFFGKTALSNFGKNWSRCGIFAAMALFGVYLCIQMLGKVF